MSGKERPYGVTALGGLWIILGLIYFAIGMGFSFFGGIIGSVAGVAVFIGIIDFILGIGCFMAWPGIWTAGVVFTAIHIVLGIISLFTTGYGALLGLIIPFIILYYLLQPHVRAAFKKA